MSEKQKLPFEVRFHVNHPEGYIRSPRVDKQWEGQDLRGLQRSGWHFAGKIHQDYYAWFENFYAYHPVHGHVKGNYMSKIEASSHATYKQFEKDHPPTTFCMGDI